MTVPSPSPGLAPVVVVWGCSNTTASEKPKNPTWLCTRKLQVTLLQAMTHPKP